MRRHCDANDANGVYFGGRDLVRCVGPPPIPGPAGEVQRSYAAQKDNLLKTAEIMPADLYQYKPTPDMRTFARVVNHVTEAQVQGCGAVNGTPPAERMKSPADTTDKATIVAGLKASFAECDKAYGSTTDANFTELLSIGPAKRTRAGVLWGNASHDTHAPGCIKTIASPANLQVKNYR